MADTFANATEPELKRLAILAMHSDLSAVNWEAAHAAFDPEKKTQLASFKTVSNRVLSKFKKAAAGGSVAGDDGDEIAVKAKKTPTKRKGAADAGTDDGEADDPTTKKAKATPKPRAKKGAKKAAAEEADEAVKSESSGA